MVLDAPKIFFFSFQSEMRKHVHMFEWWEWEVSLQQVVLIVYYGKL